MRFLALLSLVVASPAAAMDINASHGVPFTYEITKVSEIEKNGTTYTVISGTLLNGKFYLRNATIHCGAWNKDGYSWEIKGVVSGVGASEKRTFRIVSDGTDEPQYWSDPTKIECAVSDFSASVMY